MILSIFFRCQCLLCIPNKSNSIHKIQQSCMAMAGLMRLNNHISPPQIWCFCITFESFSHLRTFAAEGFSFLSNFSRDEYCPFFPVNMEKNGIREEHWQTNKMCSMTFTPPLNICSGSATQTRKSDYCFAFLYWIRLTSPPYPIKFNNHLIRTSNVFWMHSFCKSENFEIRIFRLIKLEFYKRLAIKGGSNGGLLVTVSTECQRCIFFL